VRLLAACRQAHDETRAALYRTMDERDLGWLEVTARCLMESSFRKNVTSDMGAIGPAQVKPYWSLFCGGANLSDPAENIYCGAQILAHYRDQCGSEQCALSAYNVGPKNQQDDSYYRELGLRYARNIDRHVSRFSKTVL